jgi:hypothetical protein
MVLKKVPEVTTLWGQLCFTAKSPWRSVRTGWLAPYSYLGPMAVQIRGRQGALPDFILSCHVRMVSGVLLVRNPRTMVNGNLTPKIWHAHGLCQGDPLSPMLFLLVMEVLSALIRKAGRLTRGHFSSHCSS